MKVQPVQRFRDLTEYPKLFEKSYWGNFKVNADTEIDDIATNRNKFVEEFNIEKCLDPQRPNHPISIFDHCELYKNANGLIYVTSPYGEHNQYEELAEKTGFTLYEKLYSLDSVTYYKLFANKPELNRAMRQWEKDLR